MIEGVVDERLRPLVEIMVKDGDGDFVSIPAILDTGSQFSLVMPREINSRLELKPNDDGRLVRVAGGGSQRTITYSAEIMWNGYRKEVEVVEMNNPPLIGTELLQGYNVNIEMRYGGPVVLAPLEAW